MIGTEIISFGPFKAEKNGFKDFNLHFKSWQEAPFILRMPNKKLDYIFECHSNLIFGYIQM